MEECFQTFEKYMIPVSVVPEHHKDGEKFHEGCLILMISQPWSTHTHKMKTLYHVNIYAKILNKILAN